VPVGDDLHDFGAGERFCNGGSVGGDVFVSDVADCLHFGGVEAGVIDEKPQAGGEVCEGLCEDVFFCRGGVFAVAHAGGVFYVEDVDGEFVFGGEFLDEVIYGGVEAGKTHVGGEVGDVFYFLEGEFNLGAEFGFDLIDLRIRLAEAGTGGEVFIGPDHGEEVALFVDKRRTVGKGTPFDAGPFAGEREVDADITGGVVVEHADCFVEPGAGDHDFDGTGDSFFPCFDAGEVGGVT